MVKRQESGVQNVKEDAKRAGTKNKQINESIKVALQLAAASISSLHWKLVQEAAGLLLTMPERKVGFR